MISRRHVLIGGLAVGACGLAGLRAAQPVAAADREIAFYVPATGERVRATYWSGGRYLPDGMEAVNRVLRDFETGRTGAIDFGLLDRLHAFMHRLQAKDGFEVVRGLMTDDPAQPFAPGSPDALHTLGKAIDLRAPGVTLEHLLAEFANFFDGGVGLYRQRNFVHVDTGPRRVWDAT